MSSVTLDISGGGINKEVPPDPAGVILGRDSQCDIVLPDRQISRRHALIYRDPLGRWLIQDLDSHNGVFVDNRKIDTHRLLPGEEITIGPFIVHLRTDKTTIMAGEHPKTETTYQEDSLEQTILATGDKIEPLTADNLQFFNRIGEQLSTVTSSSRIYACLCRELASCEDSCALVIRVPGNEDAPDTAPDVIAMSAHPGDTKTSEITDEHIPLHISKRVVDAVRAGQSAVSATSTGGAGSMQLTVASPEKPRVVHCAEITKDAGMLDLLYLDLPVSRAETCTLDLVSAVARQTHLAAKSILLNEARFKLEILDEELGRAKKIQTSLTPGHIEPVAGIDVGLHYSPAAWVGGDYYDLWKTPENNLVFVVADVSGHGLDAALLMANLQAALRTTMIYCADVGDALTRLNEHLLEHSPTDMFATMVLGVIKPGDGELIYANAGHEKPLLVFGENKQDTLAGSHNPLLGVMEHHFAADTCSLPPGTGLLIVTDGITETHSPSGDMLGTAGLRKMLAYDPTDTSQHTVDSLAQALKEYRGDLPRKDDETILLVKKE